MKCYAPIRAYKTPTGIVFNELKRHGEILAQLDIPCGQCVGCRERRASDWEIRIMHEAKQWKHNCFVTLTYGRDQLPKHGSLDYHDTQKFCKRLYYHNEGLRYYGCGEYGPLNGRPHYHICLFGATFTDQTPKGKSESGELFYNSPTLERIWGLGNVSVQPLNEKTASYCSRYIMNKKLGKDNQYTAVLEDGTIVNLEPERAFMSLKPGIGEGFYQQYNRDIYPHDYVITRGAKRRPPKYYDKLHERTNPDRHERVATSREERAAEHREDNTPQRLTVQEAVHVARIRNKQRHDL